MPSHNSRDAHTKMKADDASHPPRKKCHKKNEDVWDHPIKRKSSLRVYRVAMHRFQSNLFRSFRSGSDWDPALGSVVFVD